jgi:predicted nicotinamide N-methyase
METAMEDMAGLIKKGAPPPSGESIDDEKVWSEMTALIANYQRAGMGQQIARLVSNLPEFISFTKMLDLGSGAGLIIIVIPLARATILSGRVQRLTSQNMISIMY